MTLSFFDQFSLTTYLGVPLIALALLSPWLLFLAPKNRYLHNRLTALQYWFIQLSTHQLFLPVNKGGHKWAPLLMSLLIFLMSMNLLGMLPYTFTPTTQLSMNLGLAVPLWMATVLIGLRNQPTHTFAHFLPMSTPTLLIPILVMIETISLFIRPIALGVRLTANLTAGHLLIQLISTATFVMTYIAPTASLLTMTLLIFLTVLELAVAIIQAYVFVLLLSLYLQESV
uniref:ATP synthase subunit a n=1 Tax=Papyrocranus congoensis TaxID=311468 RepID=C4IX84_PAPCN|nr:ATP synthase F0 subunit 6 [Papyrocranus congoensis]BAH58966.1 ATPase subunits 6 [Papyrocranus congoensis]